MNLLLYLNSKYANSDEDKYNILYNSFKNIHKKLTNLYNESYLPLYKQCVLNNTNPTFFENEGLKFNIFKYKLESPNSKFYYIIENDDQVYNDSDIIRFYDAIIEDKRMLKILEEKIQAEYFQKIYENNEEYVNTLALYNNMTQIYKEGLSSEFIDIMQTLDSN